MFENLARLPLPVLDDVFTSWGMPPSLSKIVIMFSIFGAFMLSRVTDSVKVVVMPICALFLMAATAVVNYYIQDALGTGYTPLFKTLVATGLGQSMAACMLMAIFKTGEVRRS